MDYLLYLEVIWRIALYFPVFRTSVIFFFYAAFNEDCGILFKTSLEGFYFLSRQSYPL